MANFVLDFSLKEAVNFAGVAHATQLRKVSKAPYIIHPMEVAFILMHYDYGPTMAICGVLHDVLEDTEVDEVALKAQFGITITRIVKEVTEPDKGVTWEKRKRNALLNLRKLSNEALALKAADAISNMMDICVEHQKHGDRIFKQFKRGKFEQLARYTALTQAVMTEADNRLMFGIEAPKGYQYNTLVRKELFDELEATQKLLMGIF